MTYQIAIPSLGRSSLILSHTLKMLANNGIDASKVTVFVVEEEYEDYRSKLPVEIRIVVGHRGIIPQRKFIENYYEENTDLVSIDDDVEQVDLTLDTFSNLDDFFTKAFADLHVQGSFLWGVYPVWNQFFRKQRPSMNRDLSFIVGCLFGIRVRRCIDLDCQITKAQKEDVERCLRTFMKDGSIVRYERIGIKTKYFRNVGGLGDFASRFEESNRDSIAICDAFPHHTSLKIRKADGRHEVKFRKVPERKPTDNVELLPKCNPDIFDTLYNMLCKITIPQITDRAKGGTTRRGFPTHRAMCLGLVRQRKTGVVTQSAPSLKYPALHAEVFRLGELMCPFPFTSVHLNHNVVCPPHIDSKNTGCSCLVSFGEYTGGNLFVEGVEYNLRYQPAVFNGSSLLHWNAPLVDGGRKYSLVFYSHSGK